MVAQAQTLPGAGTTAPVDVTSINTDAAWMNPAATIASSVTTVSGFNKV